MPPWLLNGFSGMKQEGKGQDITVLSNRTTLSVKAMSEAFSLLWSFDLEVFTLGLGEFLGAITLSERYRVTLYDAAYIELARRLKCEFVTFDKKLYKKVKGLQEVKLL
jgi:predicted nucleic acid-binding protein